MYQIQMYQAVLLMRSKGKVVVVAATYIRCSRAIKNIQVDEAFEVYPVHIKWQLGADCEEGVITYAAGKWHLVKRSFFTSQMLLFLS